MGRAWPSLCLILGVEVILTVLVMTGHRKTALAALTPIGVLAGLAIGRDAGSFLVSVLLILTGLSVLLLEAAALIASPGPRPGRGQVHWGHGVFLLAVSVSVQFHPLVFGSERNSLLALGVVVILAVGLSRLAGVLRLSRPFVLLTAATFYPVVGLEVL